MADILEEFSLVFFAVAPPARLFCSVPLRRPHLAAYFGRDCIDFGHNCSTKVSQLVLANYFL